VNKLLQLNNINHRYCKSKSGWVFGNKVHCQVRANNIRLEK